jgi:flagellar biosynthesis/type III secretory pathway protein FliH
VKTEAELQDEIFALKAKTKATEDALNQAKRERQRREREERNRLENEAIEAQKQELAECYGLPRDERFEQAYGIAWQRGHSGGLGDVASVFDDIAPLIQPLPKKP